MSWLGAFQLPCVLVLIKIGDKFAQEKLSIQTRFYVTWWFKWCLLSGFHYH